MKIRNLRTVLLSSVLFAAAAAAAQASPQEELARSQAAIINALAAGAGEHAPLELERARHHQRLGRDSMLRNEYARAIELAEQASIEAAAAEAKSRAAGR